MDPFLNLIREIEKRSYEEPKKTILESSKFLTYKDLLRLSIEKIDFFLKKGIDSDSYILVLTDDRAEAYTILLACISTGVVPLILTFETTLKSLKKITDKLSFEFAFIDKSLYTKLDLDKNKHVLETFKKGFLKLNTKSYKISLFFKRIGCSLKKKHRFFSELKNSKLNLEDRAILLISSGTTGESKIIPVSRENLWEQLELLQKNIPFSEDERVLNLFSLNHVDSIITGFLYTFKTFSTLVSFETRKEFFYPEFILNYIAKKKVTGFILIPSIFNIFLKQRESLSKDFDKLPHFQFFMTGADYIPPEVWKNIEFQTKKTVYNLYGMSEIGTIATFANFEDAIKNEYDTIGKPLFDHYLIVDEDFNPVKIGELGELLVSGKTVIKEYIGEKLKLIDIKGKKYFPTGDLVQQQKEGTLQYCGRKKNIIITAGQVVMPHYIDNLLIKHKDVESAFTFGIKDLIFGEKIVSAIVKAKNKKITANDIRSYLMNNLEFSFQQPKRIRILDRLPRTASGKVNLVKIKEEFMKEDKKDTKASSLESKVLSIFKKKTGRDFQIDNKMLSECFEFDSIVNFDIIVEIEDVFDINFSLDELLKLETTKDFVKTVKSKLS